MDSAYELLQINAEVLMNTIDESSAYSTLDLRLQAVESKLQTAETRIAELESKITNNLSSDVENFYNSLDELTKLQLSIFTNYKYKEPENINSMLYLNGSTHSYYCTCGCNVFHHPKYSCIDELMFCEFYKANPLDVYICNSCEAMYISE